MARKPRKVVHKYPKESTCPCGVVYTQNHYSQKTCPKCVAERYRAYQQRYGHARWIAKKGVYRDSLYWADETWTEPEPDMRPLIGGSPVKVMTLRLDGRIEIA